MAQCSDSSHQDDDSDQEMVARGVVSADMPELETDRFGFVGGSQYTAEEADFRIPIEIVRARELKWLSMLTNWDYMMAKKFNKIRDRCRKGIPSSMRARAWQHLTNSWREADEKADLYKRYVSQSGDPDIVHQIECDIDRQFPHHEIFHKPGSHGVRSLFNILKAYTLHRTQDGYCQGQAPLAAVLIMHMPEEFAFWTLVNINDHYLVRYFEAGLEKVQIDGEILYALLKHVSPTAYLHLKKYNVEPIFFMVDWFMCAFCRNLPWATVLRVLDMFFCEGVKAIFRVALALLKHLFESSALRKRYNSCEETIHVLRNLPPEVTGEHFLTKESLKLAHVVSSKELERLNRKHLRLFREKKMKDEEQRERRRRQNSSGGGGGPSRSPEGATAGEAALVNGR